jgi:hypothetical protein
MTKPIARDPIYRRRRFDAEIIELCVRWCIAYRLSYRDLVAMMAERGVVVSHTTIHRWVIRYVPEFEKRSLSAAVQPDAPTWRLTLSVSNPAQHALTKGVFTRIRRRESLCPSKGIRRLIGH